MSYSTQEVTAPEDGQDGSRHYYGHRAPPLEVKEPVFVRFMACEGGVGDEIQDGSTCPPRATYEEAALDARTTIRQSRLVRQMRVLKITEAGYIAGPFRGEALS